MECLITTESKHTISADQHVTVRMVVDFALCLRSWLRLLTFWHAFDQNKVPKFS